MRPMAFVLLPLLALATTARAGELFGGVYIHDVKTPLNLSGIEPGLDLQIGYRLNRIRGTIFQPYAFAAVNSRGETSYAAAGVSARFGRRIYVRPGLGLAIHNGSAGDFQRFDRVAFGSRVLFQPELGLGMVVNDRLSIEASVIHLSHGTLLGRQNPGIDNIGVRVNLKL